MSDISTSGPAYRVVNPATGEVVETFEYATDGEIEEALAAVQTAYGAWRDVPIAERAKTVKRIGELFVERRAELAAIATEEMGKPLGEARGEAEFCGEIFDYFATEGPELAADQPIKTFSGGKAMVQKLPIGPLLGIMPWNYPFYQIARFAAPNLMLGQHDRPQARRVGAEVRAGRRSRSWPTPACRRAPTSTCSPPTTRSRQIIGDPRIAGVSLTGSERAGAVVAVDRRARTSRSACSSSAAPTPTSSSTPTTSPAAADLAWETRISNTGQACNSNKRMIVMDDVYDGFVARLTELAKDLRPGDPAEPRRGHVRAAVLAGRGREPGRAGRGRGQQGRHPARRRRARRGAGGVLLARGAHRDHQGDARLPRGAVRAGRGGLLGLQRRRGPRTRQRQRLRARRRGVQHRPRARDARSPSGSRWACPT